MSLLDRLDATGVEIHSMGKAKDSWNLLAGQEDVQWLNQGNTFFRFHCSVGDSLMKDDQEFADGLINLSGFEDEVKQNGVPHVNVYDSQDSAKYTFVMSKNAYIFPKSRLEDFTPEMIADYDYQLRCVPGVPSTKIWGPGDYDCPNKRTFRFTRPLIPYLYSITVQMEASAIRDKEQLKKISAWAGVTVELAILMERTKRNIHYQDQTAKMKALLMYSRVKGGILVTMATVILNTTIPSMLVPVLGHFGVKGVAEAAETAVLTRRYLAEKHKHSQRAGASKGDKAASAEDSASSEGASSGQPQEMEEGSQEGVESAKKSGKSQKRKGKKKEKAKEED